MEYEELVKTFNYSTIKDFPDGLNIKNIPYNYFTVDYEGIEKFNTIYKHCIKNKFIKGYWTPSGGISSQEVFVDNKCYFVQPLILNECLKGVKLVVRDEKCRVFVGCIKSSTKGDDGITGSQSFNAFIKVCRKFGIDINDYVITKEEGLKQKQDFPEFYIYLVDMYKDLELSGVNHLDINSSFMSGLAHYYPEFKPVVEDLYSKRAINQVYKHVLTHCYGYMQSAYVGMALKRKDCQYGLAHLSRKMVEFTNNYLRDLTIKLQNSGRTIVAYNTDGIWYKGEPYHDENEGRKIGQWKNDHINCKARFKSRGAYEYIEDGKYTPVIRGSTKLDLVKDRDNWEWGDIYNHSATVIKFVFDEEEGIVPMEGEENEES